MRCWWLAPCLLACAGAPPARPAAAARAPASAAEPAPEPAPAPAVAPVAATDAGAVAVPAATPAPVVAAVPADDPLPGVRVKGLEGTLNKDDVHQTMDARAPAFDVCIKEVRRRHRWVNGKIRFDFAIDGQGRVEEARPVESDIGHLDLERCLTRVVAETQFPKPAGRARARFSWDMQVQGVYAGGTELLEPDVMDKVLARKASKLFKECEVRRRRYRFQVTLYVANNGRILSMGAIPTRSVEDEKLDCVREEIAAWRLPKQKRRSKVSFVLR